MLQFFIDTCGNDDSKNPETIEHKKILIYIKEILQALKKKNRKIINGKEYKIIRILENNVFSLHTNLVMIYNVSSSMEAIRYTKATMQFALSTQLIDDSIKHLATAKPVPKPNPVVTATGKVISSASVKSAASTTFGVGPRKILNQTIEVIRQKHRASTSAIEKILPPTLNLPSGSATARVRTKPPLNTGSTVNSSSMSAQPATVRPQTAHEKNAAKLSEAKIKTLEQQLKQLSVDNNILKQKVAHAEKISKTKPRTSARPATAPAKQAAATKKAPVEEQLQNAPVNNITSHQAPVAIASSASSIAHSNDSDQLRLQIELLQEENVKLHHSVHNECERVKHETELFYQHKLSSISEEFTELKMQLDATISNCTIQIKQLEIEKSNLLQEKSIIEVQVTECKKDIEELQKLLIQEKQSKEKHTAIIKQLQEAIEACNSEMQLIKQENTSLHHTLKVVEEKMEMQQHEPTTILTNGAATANPSVIRHLTKTVIENIGTANIEHQQNSDVGSDDGTMDNGLGSNHQLQKLKVGSSPADENSSMEEYEDKSAVVVHNLEHICSTDDLNRAAAEEEDV